jgi:hypothetical protein
VRLDVERSSWVDREIRLLRPIQHFQKLFNFLEILEALDSEFPEEQTLMGLDQ